MSRITIFFAWRYLFAKKSTNAINVISGISVLGFMVGAFALITILSALNGFESLVGGMMREFDPALKVIPVEGKSFKADHQSIVAIDNIPGVAHTMGIIEENAVLEHNNQFGIVKLKGVPEEFPQYRNTESFMASGSFDLKLNDFEAGVFGAGIALKLGLHPGNIQFCNIFLPSRTGEISSLTPEASLKKERVLVSGIFMLQEEIDNTFVFVPRSTLERMLDYRNQFTYVEIVPEKGAEMEALKQRVQTTLGHEFKVLDRREQNESIYRIFRSEKLATYAILAFVLLLSAFNTTGSVSMIILEKKADIDVLRSMGADSALIKKIFFTLGLIIALIGGFMGSVLGVLVCWSQERWGWLKLENSVVEAYPIKVLASDVIVVLLTVVVLGVITAGIPALRAVKDGPVRVNGLRGQT